MKKFILILTALAGLMATATDLFSQEIYHVENGEIVVTKQCQTNNSVNIKTALSPLLSRTGYVKGTWFAGTTTTSAEFVTPELYHDAYSFTRARLHVTVKKGTYGNTITLTCNTVSTCFPQSDIEYPYNPCSFVPITQRFDQMQTVIDLKGVKKTFSELVRYMNKVAADVSNDLRHYEPGTYR